MKFTFLIITYNHQKFIIQHLESIKYQILNYGEDKRFQLIIADDCSTDSTVNLINLWIKDNKGLFEEIDIIVNEVNVGTCKNFTRGIKAIKGEYFKSLAGDDIYAKDSIFEPIELLKRYDIITTAIAPFTNCELYVDKKIYSRIYNMYKYASADYKKISKYVISIPMTPGVFMRKELLTDELLSFVNGFHFIEDRSLNIKLYEQNKDLRIGLYEKIVILYRHHDGAVTKTKNVEINDLFKRDSEQLYDYVIKNTNNILLKMITFYRINLNKISNKMLVLVLNLDALFYRIGFLLNYHKYKGRMNIIINDSFLPNEHHLKYIISEAEKYDS